MKGGDFRKKVRDMLTTPEGKRKPVDPQVVERLVSNYVTPGTRLRLREGVHQQLKDRNWIFNKVKENLIFLIHETGVYSIVVEVEDIDWSLP
jgi:hypothetical protein